MKKIILLLLSAALVFSGCSFTAESAPTKASSPTRATSPTETFSEDTWADIPFLSLLPELPGEWAVQEKSKAYTSAYSVDLTYEDAVQYAQSLQEAGFDRDVCTCTQELVPQTLWYRFLARDAAGNYVLMDYLMGQCDVLAGNYACVEMSSDPKAEIPAAKEAWGASTNRSVVPQPPTQRWRVSGTFGIQLDMSLEDMFAYRESLRQAGFTIRVVENDDYRFGSYLFVAYNAEGYGIKLNRNYYSESERLDTQMYIYTPMATLEYLQGYTWEELLPEGCAPEPEDFNWQITVNPFGRYSVSLEAAEYEDAVAYMQALEDYLIEQGKNAEVAGAVVVNDAEPQQLSYSVSGVGSGFDVALIYDPARESQPCVLEIRNANEI